MVNKMTALPNAPQNTVTRAIGYATRKRQRGVVLLDAMMSILIAGVVLPLVISMALAGTQTANAARQSNLAYGATRQILENMRGNDVSQMPVGSNLSVEPYGAVPQLRELPSATASVSVAVATDIGVATYAKNVTAIVTWRTGGATKTRTLSTRIAPNGVGH